MEDQFCISGTSPTETEIQPDFTGLVDCGSIAVLTPTVFPPIHGLNKTSVRKASNRMAVVIEGRYLPPVLEGIQNDGLVLMLMDHVLDWMLKNKIPITQRNYIELAYMGDKHTVDDLDGEELAELPEQFEDWPLDELQLN